MMKLVIFLIAHIIISYIYIFVFYNSYYYEKIYRGTVVLLIPIWGILFFLISDILIRFRNKEMLYDREELMAKRSKKEFLVRPDYNQYVNLVPLEEALILADPHEKRKLLLDILKKNMDGYVSYIKMAIEDKDSETSHYAASTLMELTRKHMLILQSMALEYEKKQDDLQFALSYANSLKQYADSGILEEKDRKKYLNQYIQVIEKNISKDENQISEHIYIDFIEALIDTENYSNIEKWCKKYKKLYSRSEKPYICFLKYYYLTGQTRKFFSVLKELKNSTVPISKDTLSIIRFWMEEQDKC